MKYPILSIITVCFNAESTFRDCLQSVAQGKSPEVEYLVIDGFSTDGTLDIIQEFPEIVDTLISEPDGGIFDAMNKGLKNAVGDYVVFLNADDRFLPGAIPVILNAIRTACDDVDVFYGDWIGVDASGAEHARRANHRLRWRYALCHQAVVARRTIFPVPPSFNPRYRLCADFDLILAWQAQGAHFKRIAQPIVLFSEVGSSAKFIRRSAWESIVIALRRAKSLWALVFSARVALYVARATLFSRIRLPPRPPSPPQGDGPKGAVRVVVSAVNFTEGGPLTVLRECLASAAAVLPAQCELIALVHGADLIKESRVRFVPIPSSKRSWFHRMYWEWFGFYRISRELKPALWLSLHDVTPRVSATRQAVYCHNPSPFYRIRLRDAMMEPRFLIFNQLYALLYRLFIGRNYCVIVQQEWLRAEFIRRMGHLPVVVAHPSFRAVERPSYTKSGPAFVFIYPALPRVFKNFETLCAAAQILASRGISGFEVRLTIDGSENRYSRWLRQRFSDTAQIQFIGRKTKDEMATQYEQACAVVFPSKLETWGLPITEGKAQVLPLIVADLPYARETVGNYDLVSFFPAESSEALANLMQAMIEQTWRPTGNRHSEPASPFAPDWASLWGILTSGLPSLAPTRGI
jgi:glycosyltransferase involved in cell wall biosynthesis